LAKTEEMDIQPRSTGSRGAAPWVARCRGPHRSPGDRLRPAGGTGWVDRPPHGGTPGDPAPIPRRTRRRTNGGIGARIGAPPGPEQQVMNFCAILSARKIITGVESGWLLQYRSAFSVALENLGWRLRTLGFWCVFLPGIGMPPEGRTGGIGEEHRGGRVPAGRGTVFALFTYSNRK